MDLQVVPVGAADRPRLEALMQLYVYDFSGMLGVDPGDDGHFATPAIEPYFGADPRCHAFLARVGGHLAGFALVQERSRLSGDERIRDVPEFFVLRRHRRHGVGERLAAWVFDRFPGTWEVRQRAENPAATAFWRTIIGRYTAGRFEDLQLDDARWRGPVQRFDSRR